MQFQLPGSNGGHLQVTIINLKYHGCVFFFFSHFHLLRQKLRLGKEFYIILEFGVPINNIDLTLLHSEPAERQIQKSNFYDYKTDRRMQFSKFRCGLENSSLQIHPAPGRPLPSCKTGQNVPSPLAGGCEKRGRSEPGMSPPSDNLFHPQKGGESEDWGKSLEDQPHSARVLNSGCSLESPGIVKRNQFPGALQRF